MDNVYFLLILLSILPLVYKFSFWLYLIQLKEYRIDRFKEYLQTLQWKRAIFNFWFFIEIPMFFLIISVFFIENIEIIVFKVFFYFLLLQNVFVLWKIFRRLFIRPKLTFKVLILSFLLVIDFVFSCYLSLLFYPKFLYIIILLWLLIPYVFIFLWNYIINPFVKHKKNKIIYDAIKKSKILNKPIKIWITWSYWKTSVKEFLYTILNQNDKTLKTPKNINTEIGVSRLIIQKLNNSYKYFIAEMWAYKIWEIKLLWEIVNHKFWFLTAIWNQHLWLFWSIDNTKQAKFEIINKILENKGVFYINWDNKNVRAFKLPDKLNIVKYWLKRKDLDIKWEIIKVKDLLTKFKVKYKNKDYIFSTYLIWEHNILNLTWIIAFCLDIWIQYKELKKYILKLKNLNNTFFVKKINYKQKQIIVIDDTYNLSEKGLLAGIKTLKYFNWRKILIVDDILELGKQSSIIHFKLWEKIGKKVYVDNIFYIWTNNKEDFITGLVAWWFDKNNLLNNLNNIKKNDVLLFEWRGTKKYLNKF